MSRTFQGCDSTALRRIVSKTVLDGHHTLFDTMDANLRGPTGPRARHSCLEWAHRPEQHEEDHTHASVETDADSHISTEVINYPSPHRAEEPMGLQISWARSNPYRGGTWPIWNNLYQSIPSLMKQKECPQKLKAVGTITAVEGCLGVAC